MKETELYPPIKAFLQSLGLEVKSELLSCDVVALSPDQDPVIVELKTGFTIQLLYQAIDRLAICDQVYVAIPMGKGRLWRGQMKRAVKLCRRIGIGLLAVRMRDGFVEILTEPQPYQPRKNRAQKARLLSEFAARQGDHNTGGQTGRKIITAYRQDALRLARMLAQNGPASPKHLAQETGISKAGQILYANHYGWFFRVERGLYTLSDKGAAESRQA